MTPEIIFEYEKAESPHFFFKIERETDKWFSGEVLAISISALIHKGLNENAAILHLVTGC